MANAQKIVITLFGVSDRRNTNNLTIPVAFLEGDTNVDGRVNVGDTNQAKSRSGQATNDTNKRSDVNLDGRIKVGDTNFVKAHSAQRSPSKQQKLQPEYERTEPAIFILSLD